MSSRDYHPADRLLTIIYAMVLMAVIGYAGYSLAMMHAFPYQTVAVVGLILLCLYCAAVVVFGIIWFLLGNPVEWWARPLHECIGGMTDV